MFVSVNCDLAPGQQNRKYGMEETKENKEQKKYERKRDGEEKEKREKEASEKDRQRW